MGNDANRINKQRRKINKKNIKRYVGGGKMKASPTAEWNCGDLSYSYQCSGDCWEDNASCWACQEPGANPTQYYNDDGDPSYCTCNQSGCPPGCYCTQDDVSGTSGCRCLGNL